MPPSPESLTRKSRIDPKLDARGWRRVKAPSPTGACRTEEHPTAHGPADYALFLDGHPVAIVEAKKTAVDPQNVLTQAERYARGLADSPYDFDGIHVPFLYSTNGEQIWFRDARKPESRSRRVADFHTPEALGELLSRDFDGACRSIGISKGFLEPVRTLPDRISAAPITSAQRARPDFWGLTGLSRTRRAVCSIPPWSAARQFSQSPPSPPDSAGGGRAGQSLGASRMLVPRLASATRSTARMARRSAAARLAAR